MLTIDTQRGLRRLPEPCFRPNGRFMGLRLFDQKRIGTAPDNNKARPANRKGRWPPISAFECARLGV